MLYLRAEDDAGFHVGADISFLSQFAAEKEYLFPPLTMLRVVERHGFVEGEASRVSSRNLEERILAARVADEAKAAAQQVEPEIEKRRRENMQAQQAYMESHGLDQKTLRKQAMKRDADGKYAKPPGRVPKGMRWDGDDGEWVPDPDAETEGESSMGADNSIAPGEQTVEATQVLVPETWEERADEETEAVRATIRSNHLEVNVLGPQPTIPSPLAAQVREQLVRSNMPLPGEGEARIDLTPSTAASSCAARAAVVATMDCCCRACRASCVAQRSHCLRSCALSSFQRRRQAASTWRCACAATSRRSTAREFASTFRPMACARSRESRSPAVSRWMCSTPAAIDTR